MPEEIIIKIKSPDAAESENAPLPPRKKNGVLGESRNADYLPRRKKKDGFINFYDLGQILIEGEWKDSINLNIGYTYTPGTLGNAGTVNVNNFNTATGWAALKNIILATPFNDWRTKYRKIEYAPAKNYYLQVSGDDEVDKLLDENFEKWSSNGLKLDDADSLRVKSSVAFLGVGFDDEAKYKITASASADADAVNLSLNGGADIFLMPQIFARYGESNLNTVPLAIDAKLLADYGSMSREEFLNQFLFTDAGYKSLFIPPFNITIRRAENIALFLDTVNYFKSRPNAALFVRRVVNQSSGGEGFEPATSFPVPSAENYHFLKFYSINALHQNNFLNENALVAVVIQNNVSYYVWARAASIGIIFTDVFFLSN